MKPKSKKAFTLVEMIVSFALIAIVSIMLLGILVPAANLQATTDKRNIGLNNAAQPLEKQTVSATLGTTVSQNTGATVTFSNGVSCSGTMYTSTDTKSGVSLYQFVPTTP